MIVIPTCRCTFCYGKLVSVPLWCRTTLLCLQAASVVYVCVQSVRFICYVLYKQARSFDSKAVWSTVRCVSDGRARLAHTKRVTVCVTRAASKLEQTFPHLAMLNSTNALLFLNWMKHPLLEMWYSIFSACELLSVKAYEGMEVYRNAVAYLRIFSGGGVQQIQLRTEGRENGDLEAVAP
jgi:hypothetical protein